MRNVPANFIADSTAATEQYRVDNRFGFAPGDLILATEPGVDCTLSQVSALPLGSDQILYNTGSYTDPATGNPQQLRYNRVGGLGVSYTANAKLYNLGRLPARTVYSISNSRLMAQDTFTGAAAIPIVDGIVQLQAEYGRDTTMPIMDWTVDVWDTTTPANSDGWKRVVAVRLAVVARSGLRERPDVDTNTCITTTTLPKWKTARESLSPMMRMEQVGNATGTALTKRSSPCATRSGGPYEASLLVSFIGMARPREQGIVLFIALIVLVAMALAGIALMRSVDTTIALAGNLAFRQSATQAADRGIEAATQWLVTQNSTPNTLHGNDAAEGYFSAAPASEPDWYDAANWEGADAGLTPKTLAADAAGTSSLT